MTAVVETEGLTKFYGARRGLEDLDLEIRPGEVFGYLGPNGAGKTTTIRLLLDVIRPTRGRMKVLGQDPRQAGAGAPREGRQKPGELPALPGAVRDGVPKGRIEGLAERLEADLSVPMGKLS